MEAGMLTFGSLFAGIGGFDLGFERAGFQCKWQVEIDTYATKILERHWPDVHRERDIRQCGRHNLERVDCIIGGFPCQDISYAGKRAGLDGARSGLWYEFARIVCELEPRIVCVENVSALLTRGLDQVLGTLASFGFDAQWHCIPAAAVGAPHIRDRVFILAYRQGESAFAEHAEVAQLPSGNVADTEHKGLSRTRGEPQHKSQVFQPCNCSSEKGRGNVADTQKHGRHKGKPDRRRVQAGIGAGQECGPRNGCEVVANANGHRSQARLSKQKQWQEGDAGKPFNGGSGWPSHSGWWQSEPAVGELVDGVSGGLVRFAGRVATGIPNRVHKLRCLGNAIVPQVAEVVARMAMDRLTGGNDGW
jgi:DNA (cytosine-5)-methyltransferase 1